MEKGQLIQQLFSLKFDIKVIRADLAHFCHNLLSIGFPNHPALSDDSACNEQPMEFSDLYACLEDSLSSNSSGSTDSDSFFVTKNPISNYKIDSRSEAQIEADRLLAIKKGIKTEPVDPDEQKESTPLASPNK